MPKLLFDSAIEGTFVIALGNQLTPRIRERLAKEANIDLKTILPAYDVDAFLRAVRITQEELKLEGDDGERALGAMSFRGFAQTLIGRAATAFTRIIGPDRTVPRMAQNMRAGVNFMDITTEKLAPRHYRMTVSEVGGLPHFYGGLFESGISMSARCPVSAKVETFDGHRCVYDITW